MNYVFICTGNICRSAMAEAMAKHLTCDNVSITFSSMGIQAVIDAHADKKAIEVCSEIGVDVSKHIARELKLSELQDAEKIICMDRGHLEFISSITPLIAEKAGHSSSYS